MGWFEDAIRKLQSSPVVDYTHARIGTDGEALAPDRDYVRVWLRSARLVEVRRWTRKMHATVHGRFVYADPVQGEREVVTVVAPDKSFEEMDPRNLDRFIVVNQPLLGPIPYRGELGMEIGLFSVAAADLAKPYLELLSNLTATASVAFLGQVKPFVEPIKRGAELLLFNGSNAELEIGVARTDTSLSSGSLVVARTPKGTVDFRKLTVDPHDFRLLGPRGAPLEVFPYMVIGIERLSERDYAKIPEIRQGWDAVRTAAREGRPEMEIAERFAQLRRVILLSPDLVPGDRRRIVDALTQELAAVGYGAATGPAAGPRALESAPVVILRPLAAVLPGSEEERAPDEARAVPEAAGTIKDDAAVMAALADREAKVIEVGASAARELLENAIAVPSDVAARVSPRTYDLIVRHETGGRDYYERRIKKRPVWPGGVSGITIGFGYDLGYVQPAEFERDWELLSAIAREALKGCVGFHAGKEHGKAELQELLARVGNVVVEWEIAEAVFKAATLPKFAALTWRSLPNCDRLHNDCFGALVSLTFNRGVSYDKAHDPAKDPKDRYREMRAIKAAMQGAAFVAIPGQIRAMKRIWAGTDIEAEMYRRRENEAAAFEAGLVGMGLAAVVQGTGLPSTYRGMLEATVTGGGVLPADAETWSGPGDEEHWEELGEDELAAEVEGPGRALAVALEAAVATWAPDSDSPDYAHLGPGLLPGLTFPLLPEDLELLAGLNDFPVEESSSTPVLFGLRGCGIIKDHAGSSREVILQDWRPDHVTPRCVLGVWDRRQGRVFVFSGSTVPNAAAVAAYVRSGRSGNLLPTGLYGYIVGPHVTSKSRPGCFLLRRSLSEKRVVIVRRSRDDLMYTDRDIVDPCMPGDNIHPTFYSRPVAFSSFGCQTVVGTADERGNHRGPWAEFRRAAGLTDDDGDPGKPYQYMLLTGAEARLASELRRGGLASDRESRLRLRRLRYGSRGDAVRALQVALGIGRPDGDFGRVTCETLHARQRAESGDNRSNGIVTPLGAGKLGVDLMAGMTVA